jgi:hypothetical protein
MSHHSTHETSSLLGESTHTNSAAKIGTAQNVLAVTLGVLSLLLVSFQALAVVFNMGLFMELYQFETTTYLLCYVPITLVLTLVWVAIHHYFVGRFKPDQYGNEHTRVTSTELSRVRSLQLMLVALITFLVAVALIFESRFPGDIAIGDGHIVQNGMDTRSALYSLWLIILTVIFLGGSYVVTHAVYLPDLYFNQFRKHFKANQN